MPRYSLNTVTIINRLRIQDPEIKQVWLADDAAASGKIKQLHTWFDHLITEGKKYGYYVNESKSWLIVKSVEIVSEANTIFGKNVNITNEGISAASWGSDRLTKVQGPVFQQKG